MIKHGNTFLLSIFFLYLVLMSSNLNTLLACNVQRTLANNLYIQHILLFLSIFMFTFILKWYSPESLYVSHKDKIDKESINEDGYLLTSFYYTFGIYVLFILSSKQTYVYMEIFLLLLFSLLVLFLYYAVLLQKNNIHIGEFEKLFISSDDIDHDKSLIYVHNTLSIGYILLILNVFIGSYSYYIKQSKEHKNWSWITFFLGNNKCRNI